VPIGNCALPDGLLGQALEISEQTFHRWQNQYGGMKAAEAKRLSFFKY
jgi:hypothetical protein